MGLIYNPSESRELMSNFQSNINTCDQIVADLKAGNRQLIRVLNSHQLSGSAFTAGQGLFTQLVIPTVSKADTVIQKLNSKLQQYGQYTGAAGGEILDEDKLNQQLEALRRQQATLSSQIRVYQNQARSSEEADITAMCYSYASSLTNFMGTIQEDIRQVEEKLKKLHELDMKLAPLFSGITSELSNLTTVISAIGSGNFDQNGNFKGGGNKNIKALQNILLDYGSGAVQDGLSEVVSGLLSKIDTAMPNSGSYMRVFSDGNSHWKNTHIRWDSAGYGNAVSNSLLKKGVKSVTVNEFGIGKAKISGLGTLGFGIDYYQNRADGETVGRAFTHTAATTVIAGTGSWAMGTGLTFAAGTSLGSALGLGTISGFIVSNPVGWAIGAGIAGGFVAKIAYDNNFLGLQDGVKSVGKALDSGLDSIKSVFHWGKKKNA